MLITIITICLHILQSSLSQRFLTRAACIPGVPADRSKEGAKYITTNKRQFIKLLKSFNRENNEAFFELHY